MHEPLLERIRQLEMSVRRRRLACLALLIVVVSLVAIGGTFGVILSLQVPDRRQMEMERADAELARDQAQQAIQAERVANRAGRTSAASGASSSPAADGRKSSRSMSNGH
jgi:hypothetical protein